MSLKLVLVLCLLGLSGVFGAISADEVDPSKVVSFEYTSKVYSGYLTISDGTEGLHYLFFESQDDPTNDPVMLWLNGGPGCSSFLGALQENGPWLFVDGAQEPTLNPYSWNNHINVIYLESPAGVGFSYSNVDPKDRNYTDPLVADGNLEALLGWFEGYPEYKANDFYVAGESYGGMYVPWLSAYIDNYNNNASTAEADKINFKGFAVGNGLTDLRYDWFGPSSAWSAQENYMDFKDYHAVFSLEMEDLLDNVCFQNDTALELPECQELLTLSSDAMQGINMYDIYGRCYYSDASGNKLENHHYAYFLTKNPFMKHLLKLVPPCLDISGPTAYLRNETIREAFNIPSSIQQWTECSAGIGDNYQVSPEGSIWAYHQLVGKIKTMFFSGDTDSSVPITASSRWIDQMRIELDLLPYNLWSPWYIAGETSNAPQVAGYVTSYQQNFTFVTVRGAGHMVPQYRPAEAYLMIENWVFDRSFI